MPEPKVRWEAKFPEVVGPAVRVQVVAEFPDEAGANFEMDQPIPALELAMWSVDQSGTAGLTLHDDPAGPATHRVMVEWKGVSSGIAFTSVTLVTEPAGEPIDGATLGEVAAKFEQWSAALQSKILVEVATQRQSFSISFPHFSISIEKGAATLTMGDRVAHGRGTLRFVVEESTLAGMEVELARRQRLQLTDDDYREVARVYADAVERGAPVLATVGRMFGGANTGSKAQAANRKRAERWIAEARSRGYIAKRAPGRPAKKPPSAKEVR